MKCHGLYAFVRNKDGVAVVEFALVAPVFFFFLLFVLEYGLVSFGNSVITNLVSQTARLSMVGCLDAEYVAGTTDCDNAFNLDADRLKDEIIQRSFGLVRANDATLFALNVDPLGVGPTDCDLGQGGEVRVFRVSYQWPVFFKYLSNFGWFSNIVNFTTLTIVRNEPFGTIANRTAGAGAC